LDNATYRKHRIKCFGEAPNTLHIYSVIGNGQNSKLLPLKSLVKNMQWLVKSVSSSFFTDLSHEAKAKDSTLKAKAKTKDFKIVLEDPRGRELVLEDSNTTHIEASRVTISNWQHKLGNGQWPSRIFNTKC